MKIMDESVTVSAQEQCAFAERLVAMGRRLEARAATTGMVVEGKVAASPNREQNMPPEREDAAPDDNTVAWSPCGSFGARPRGRYRSLRALL